MQPVAAAAPAGKAAATAAWQVPAGTVDLVKMLAMPRDLVDPSGEGVEVAQGVARKIRETEQRLADQAPPAAKRKTRRWHSPRWRISWTKLFGRLQRSGKEDRVV